MKIHLSSSLRRHKRTKLTREHTPKGSQILRTSSPIHLHAQKVSVAQGSALQFDTGHALIWHINKSQQYPQCDLVTGDLVTAVSLVTKISFIYPFKL